MGGSLCWLIYGLGAWTSELLFVVDEGKVPSPVREGIEEVGEGGEDGPLLAVVCVLPDGEDDEEDLDGVGAEGRAVTEMPASGEECV